jgi:hypothetical protein
MVAINNSIIINKLIFNYVALKFNLPNYSCKIRVCWDFGILMAEF